MKNITSKSIFLLAKFRGIFTNLLLLFFVLLESIIKQFLFLFLYGDIENIPLKNQPI